MTAELKLNIQGLTQGNVSKFVFIFTEI